MCSTEDQFDQKEETSDDTYFYGPAIVIPTENSDTTGYHNLVNVYRESHKEDISPPKRSTMQPSRASKRFNISIRSSIETNPPKRLTLSSMQGTRFNMSKRSSIASDVTTLSGHRSEGTFSCNSRCLIDESQYENCMNSTIQTIVDNEFSWYQIQQQMKDARLVTSLGIHEVCCDFIKDKADEIREERTREANKLRETQISKLRKRLSVFG